MTLDEFQRRVFDGAISSPICDIPVARRITATSVNLRIVIAGGGYVDAFHNEQTGTTAFALIVEGCRVFGVDNTGGWHVHPFDDPERHDPLPDPMSFKDFVKLIENR